MTSGAGAGTSSVDGLAVLAASGAGSMDAVSIAGSDFGGGDGVTSSGFATTDP